MAKKKIVSIVGARPQFIKASPLSQALEKEFNHTLIHTGQHYDRNLSTIFFQHLGLPKPDFNLNIGSGTHGQQTGRMLEKLEAVLEKIKPRLVVVYGDTNSTLAGALAATKMHFPVAHVEAGMRSFNKKMPEERNRILTDHISDLLFCSTSQSAQWLRDENITHKVYVVGDIMLDALRLHTPIANKKSTVLKKISHVPGSYVLATVHRAENTDDPIKLKRILVGLKRAHKPIVFPLHPRTRKKIRSAGLTRYLSSNYLTVLPPASYLDMLALEQNAQAIVTDSGGIQKEALYFHIPCITLRDETEWVETVEHKCNTLVGQNTALIARSIRRPQALKKFPALYGKGHTAEKIFRHIRTFLN